MLETPHDLRELRRSLMKGVLGRPNTQASAPADAASDNKQGSSSEDDPESRPRKRVRTSKAMSRNKNDERDDTLSDAIAMAYEEAEEPINRTKNKGKEREHTSEEEDSQAENVGSLDGSGEATSEEEEEEEAEGALELEEEDLDDDDDDKPVYHHDIWNRLVNLAGRSGSYTYPPAHGNEPEDVTAFEPTSAVWGKLRINRPPVLSLWMPPSPRNDPDYEIEDLTYNDRVVLDWKGEPIRKFRELPLTIASTVEGFRVEAWLRIDSRVTYRDVVARMRTKTVGGHRVPIYGTRALATRASNFRDHVGCVSWKVLASQAKSRAYMDGLRTAAERRNNLTTGTDLTSAQRAAYYSISRNRRSQDATVGTADRSLPRPNVGGSSSAGSSDPHRNALDPIAGGPDTPGPGTPPRRSRRRRTASRRYQEDTCDDEIGENIDNKRDENDQDEALVETIPGGIDEEGGFSNTNWVDGIGEEALLNTNQVNQVDEEAQLPYPFYLDRLSERFTNSDQNSYDFEFDLDDDDDAADDGFRGNDFEDSDSASECSVTSEPEDPDDARNHMPEDIEEALVLRAALSATQEDFRRLTGQYPTEADPMDNYFSQWTAYQTQLSTVLQARGLVEARTILFGLDGWVGGIRNWTTARPALNDRTFGDEEV